MFGSGNNFFGAPSGGFYPLEINQSLRFNDNDSAYLSRTPTAAGNRKTWTWSGWVKLGNTGTRKSLIVAYDGTLYTYLQFFTDDKIRFYHVPNTSGAEYDYYTSAVYRDPSAWYHVVISVDTTNATSTDRIRLYINGVREQLNLVSAYGQIPQNTDTIINSTNNHWVGAFNGVQLHDGYMAEIHFTDGTAYTADTFGEFKSGIWVAKQPSVTYGTNGFYLDFANSGSLGTDASGTGNNWTPNNLSTYDQVPDSPTNNFATLPSTGRMSVGYGQYAEGNLRWSNTPASGNYAKTVGWLMSSGKWYWEVMIGGGVSTYLFFNGLINESVYQNGSAWPATSGTHGIEEDGQFWSDGTNTATYTSFAVNDILQIWFDADNGDLYMGKNNTAFNSGSPVKTGLGACRVLTSLGGSSIAYSMFNFGQDDTFAGATTSGGYTDANGLGVFKYPVPSGYLSLCSANLPEPSISPLNDESPADYMTPITYTGNGSSLAVTGIGFQPDFTWIKCRSLSYGNHLFDTIRGAEIALRSDGTYGDLNQGSTYGALKSFDSDGFSVDVGSAPEGVVNQNGQNFISWNWLAGGTPVSNTDGTITSSVSANTKSGFSIVSYTGTGANGTVGHGLNEAPEVVIIKDRDATSNWNSYWSPIGATKWMTLNGTNAAQTASTLWQNTAPTSSVFYLGTSTSVNSTNNLIAYCFHSVDGMVKVGKYTGNGSSDGPFVYCGLKPSWIVGKRTDAADDWFVYDVARDTYNAATYFLNPNTSDADDTSGGGTLDILSNGFKWRTTSGMRNASGGTYIFIAFAESPFKYSNAR